jgi:hypothetical protein
MTLQFNSLLNEISGDYDGVQFVMSVKVIGDEEPELYFHDENYYTLDGDPKNIQPQKRLELKEFLAAYIYGTQQYDSMLRDWNIAYNAAHQDYYDEY